MNETYDFDGSTEARGRNGWFQLHTVDIICAPDLKSPIGQAVRVYMQSKVAPKFPPIYLNFTNPDELRQLICGLAKALHCMTHPEEEPHA